MPTQTKGVSPHGLPTYEWWNARSALSNVSCVRPQMKNVCLCVCVCERERKTERHSAEDSVCMQYFCNVCIMEKMLLNVILHQQSGANQHTV